MTEAHPETVDSAEEIDEFRDAPADDIPGDVPDDIRGDAPDDIPGDAPDDDAPDEIRDDAPDDIPGEDEAGIPDEPAAFVEELRAHAELPETGEPRVDEVLAGLAGIESRPTGDHVGVYDQVHRGLQDALANLDQG